MKFTKLVLTGVLAVSVPFAAYGGLVKADEPNKASEDAWADAWEKAAKEAGKPTAPKIDEDYVKKNIDTPTGKEEKAREDAYQDKAEKEYNRLLKEQEGKKPAKPQAPQKDTKKPVEKKVKAKVLPKTSAVR